MRTLAILAVLVSWSATVVGLALLRQWPAVASLLMLAAVVECVAHETTKE